MNKADIVEKITKDAGLTKLQAGKAVEAFIEAVTGALKVDEKVILVGFGTFKRVEKKARKGRNPQTSQTIQIKAKKAPKFVPSKLLKDADNG